MTYQLSEFIDIHTHILPGLDDGPQDTAGSIAIARCYANVGITKVFATPHFLPGTAWAPDRKQVLKTLHELQISLDRAGIDLRVVPGMEIAYHKKLEERIRTGSVLPLGTSRYYLIEPSFQGEQEGLLACLHSLLANGVKLILAHPERVEMFQQMPQLLKKLVHQGLRIQINAGSLLGYFGEKSKVTAEILRQSNCIHFIASDAHNNSNRCPLDATQWENLLASPGGEQLLLFCKGNIDEIFHADEGYIKGK